MDAYRRDSYRKGNGRLALAAAMSLFYRDTAFVEQVSIYSSTGFNITVDPGSVDLTYSTALYDAIMLYARVATTVLSKGGNLRDGEAVTAAVRSTTFEGVGGSAVSLDSSGDRVESYEMMNYVLEAGHGINVPVGVYNSTDQQYRASNKRLVVWPGNMTEVPKDSSGRNRIAAC